MHNYVIQTVSNDKEFMCIYVRLNSDTEFKHIYVIRLSSDNEFMHVIQTVSSNEEFMHICHTGCKQWQGICHID